MLLRTWTIAWKEFIQIRRDARMLTVVVVIPVVMLLLYGYAIKLDVEDLRLGVLDRDHSSASRNLIDAFSESTYFTLSAYLTDYAGVEHALDTGHVKLAMVIPRGFEESIASGRRAEVQVLVDGADSTTATTGIGYTNALLREHSSVITLQALQRSGAGMVRTAVPISNRIRYWYNPELNSTNFIVPGLIAVILMMLAALLTSMTVVRERERGTIEKLIVSPVMPVELILGKLLPYIAISFFDVVLVIGASRLLFQVPLVGSPALVLLLSGVFVTAALGIGMLISTVATSQQFAMTAAMMGTQLPSVLLSGFIFPVSSMPPAVRALSNIIPATHFVRILRGIFLKGNDLTILWQPSLLLLLLGIAMILLSTWRFRKKL